MTKKSKTKSSAKRKASKTFKTHEELGISFAEWGALWAFKAIGEAGIVLRESAEEPDKYDAMEHGAHLFNMSISCQKHHCGSVTCIGGTVALFIRNPHPSRYVTAHEGDAERTVLTPLYYPEWKNGKPVKLKARKGDIGFASYCWDRITVTMAAKAVDNVLRTGKPNWESIIPRSWWRERETER